MLFNCCDKHNIGAIVTTDNLGIMLEIKFLKKFTCKSIRLKFLIAWDTMFYTFVGTHFCGKYQNFIFCTSDFLWYFSFDVSGQKKLFSNVIKHTLFKHIHIHGLDLLNFVYIFVFDVETALEDVKIAISE